MRISLPVTASEFTFDERDTLVSVTDTSGSITYCNHAFIHVSGYAREELLGRPHNMIRHPDMPAEAFRDMWETIASGRPWTGLVKNRRKNGDFYWVQANVTPMREGDRITGLLSVRTQPMHEQVQAVQALYATMRAQAEAGQQFVRTGSCALPAPDADPATLADDVSAPLPSVVNAMKHDLTLLRRGEMLAVHCLAGRVPAAVRGHDPAQDHLTQERKPMTINTTLNKVAASVSECLAAGYVDTASGMLLAIKTVDSHPREVIDLVAAATADLFNGPNVPLIERMFKKSRGLQDNDDHHYFQEIIVNSDNLIHVCLRGKTQPDYVAVFVCRRTANLGMALTKARIAMPELEAAL